MKSINEIKIRGYHEDHFQHVNNTRYLEFLEEGRWTYFEDNNLIENLFHRNGLFLAVVNMNINYRRGAVAGDILHIETEFKSAGKQTVILAQRIYSKHSNELILDAEITNVFLEIKSRKPFAINNEMVQVWPELSTSANTEMDLD